MTLHVGSVGPPIRGNTMETEVLRQGIAILATGRQGILSASDFAVTQNGTPNMSVNVASGFALVAGTQNPPVQGTYNVYNDATTNLAIAASNPTNPRIDVVALVVDDAYYGSSNNTPYLGVITGTPGGSPSVPAVPSNALVLAHVYVGAGVSSITNSNINTTSGTGNPDTIAFQPYRCTMLQAFSNMTAGTSTTTASPGTLIPGLSAAVNVQPNRNIRIRAKASVQFSATTTPVTSVIRDGLPGTAVDQAYITTPGAGYEDIILDFIDSAPSSGMHTYGVYMYMSGGAPTATFATPRGQIVIEDDGPV